MIHSTKLQYLFILVLSLFFNNIVEAQLKFIRIDKTGSVKTKKIFEGNYISFKLKGENEPWERQKIKKLDTKNGYIHFDQYFIKLDEIESLRSTRRWANYGGKMLMTFGVSWGIISVLSIPAGNKLGTNSWAVPVASIGLGYGVLKLFGYKKMKIGKKYKLRLIDTSFE